MRWPLFRARVEGLSMIPTLSPGETVWIRRARSCAPGDLVAALDPEGRLVVKRVVRAESTADGSSGWWLEGDNPGASTDSRIYGPVPQVRIIGRVVRPRQQP